MLKLSLEAVECFERDADLRLPFRFGVITVTRATQAVIRATIALEDGRTSVGVAAETLAAKWFDKNPAFSDAQNLDQLRQSLAIAIDLYRAQGLEHAVRPLCRHLRASSMARGADARASCRWSPPTARRCSTAPSSMRWAAPPASPSPT